MKTAREIIAGALDAEIWQMDAPVPTRADTEAFHRRRQQSVVSADAILAALAAEGFIVEAGPARIDLPARERRALDKLMERAGSIVTSEALA
jgi:DNA-binding response OmpR family regulator